MYIINFSSYVYETHYNNMFHQILGSSPDNDVEDDRLLEITKSTPETKLSKSDP